MKEYTKKFSKISFFTLMILLTFWNLILNFSDFDFNDFIVVFVISILISIFVSFIVYLIVSLYFKIKESPLWLILLYGILILLFLFMVIIIPLGFAISLLFWG